jgi:hypothetical protein
MSQASNAVVDLFWIVTHRDLKKHCATAIIPKTDLAVFIMACGDPGMPPQSRRSAPSLPAIPASHRLGCGAE